MANIDEAIGQLRRLFEEEAEALARLQSSQSHMNPADFDDNRERYERRVRESREALARYVDDRLYRYGRHFDRHGALMKNFYAVAPFERSAFIMTKYPEGDKPDAKRLQKIIDLVASTLAAEGLAPRVAKDATFHPGLWDNVELHALGCRVGVAIVEGRYLAEFNPNVAMEWGWMRGVARPVIFLVENQFKLRADIEGIIRAPFDWDDPETTVPAAMKNGLTTLKNSGLL